ncbi:MAG: hypothetical protein JWQ19_3719 [Subtercola sp.]|nr:hypothetical protein [Subtercola sp.]
MTADGNHVSAWRTSLTAMGSDEHPEFDDIVQIGLDLAAIMDDETKSAKHSAAAAVLLELCETLRLAWGAT